VAPARAWGIKRMWVSLILSLFIVAVLLFQGMHGLYSAMIMMVLTLCCAGAALGTYEWVAVNWLSGWRPDYAFPLALALTFGVPLLLLRVTFDQTFRRAGLVPSIVDRVGGGACGLVTALTVVGVFAIALQQIPFGTSVLGYARFDVAHFHREPGEPNPEPPDEDAVERELFLKPDRFALRIGAMLSDGIFSGTRSFSRNNPDIIQAAGWVNTTHREVSRYAPPKSIAVVRTGPVDFVYRFTSAGRVIRRRSRRTGATTAQVPQDTYDPIKPKAGYTFQAVRVKLKKKARDVRKSHVFTLRQFRLVGWTDDDASFEQYYPIAIQAADPNYARRHIRYEVKGKADWPVVDTIYSPLSGSDDEVEVVFEIPRGFEPEYIEYKQAARAPLDFSGDGDITGATADAAVTAPGSTSSTASAGSGPGSSGQASHLRGNVRGLTTRVAGSHFGEELPLTLTAYRGTNNVSISRGAIASGHLVGDVADQEDGTDPPVSRFDVPSDKRLLHLNVGRLQARSTLGRALSFAVNTIQNYTVEDTDGRRYRFIGEYAIANVGGDEIIELQYFRDQVGTVGGVGKLSKIQNRHLKGDYELVLLFLVDPGAHIKFFSTGGSASRRDDLERENLIAPR
ncbi:MAG: hypothetical protein ACE5E6_08725, partial [Phycisphaerae bacterium]